MALKHVEKIRAAIVRQQVTALSRLRFYVSSIDENPAAIEALRGEIGEVLLARVVDTILRGIGHETDTPVEEKTSHVRRAIARVRGKGTSKDDEA